MKWLQVLDGGPLTTIQDSGRGGLGHLGVPPSGFLDGPAARLANRLVGNAEDAALLETTGRGPTLQLDSSAGSIVVAITGAPAAVRSTAGHSITRLLRPSAGPDTCRRRRFRRPTQLPRFSRRPRGRARLGQSLHRPAQRPRPGSPPGRRTASHRPRHASPSRPRTSCSDRRRRGRPSPVLDIYAWAPGGLVCPSLPWTNIASLALDGQPHQQPGRSAARAVLACRASATVNCRPKAW